MSDAADHMRLSAIEGVSATSIVFRRPPSLPAVPEDVLAEERRALHMDALDDIGEELAFLGRYIVTGSLGALPADVDGRPMRAWADLIGHLIASVGESMWIAGLFAVEGRLARHITTPDRPLMVRARTDAAAEAATSSAHRLVNVALRLGAMVGHAGAPASPTVRRALTAMTSDGDGGPSEWLSESAGDAVAEWLRDTSNPRLQRLAQRVGALCADDAWRALVRQRGLHMHRLRPLSLAATAEHLETERDEVDVVASGLRAVAYHLASVDGVLAHAFEAANGDRYGPVTQPVTTGAKLADGRTLSYRLWVDDVPEELR